MSSSAQVGDSAAMFHHASFRVVEAPAAATLQRIGIVLNWFEELKQRVPAK